VANKWYDIFKPKAGSKTTKVVLYDDIGGLGKTAKDFVADLDAVKTPKIDLHINSYGGEIVDGLACYNAVKNHDAEVTVHIDGIAASIASVVALAGDKVRIAKNAFVMIHNGWGLAVGDPAEMRKSADVLDKLCGSIAQAYADKSGKSLEDCRKAMDEETWFNAAEAKAWGLVDEIEGDGDEKNMAVSALLAVAKYQKAPPALRKFAAQLVRENGEGQQKESNMEKLVCRDGKWFLGETEVDVSACVASAKPVESLEKAMAQAREEGLAQGRRVEAEYRAMFNTVVATAKLDTVGAAEFEKTFYGRAEADLKFLASHAIGQRAKPLGEGTPGNGEGEQVAVKAMAEADDKALIAECEARWAKDRSLRLMHGCVSNSAEDPVYKNRLARYVAAEKKCRADQAKALASAGGEENDDRSDDPISKALKNHSVRV
jgi:ATP-dependent Clp endopeptidase proteolytic subunit ClpP